MSLRSALRAFALCAPCAAAAEDAGGTPTPDPGTTSRSQCIDQSGDYQTLGKAVVFVVGLANKCDKRLRCELFAYFISAKGPSSGHAILVLGARSKGEAAKETHAMKVKMAGGTAMISRECRVF